MNEPQRPKATGGKARAETDGRTGDDIETQIEDGVEELAATFGAGPKAAPKPEGPMEGQQLAP
jgi:hypothetical protein